MFEETPTARAAPEWIHPNQRIVDGLTFDDILVMPCKSQILPKKADTKVLLCPGIELYAPLISSPMDRVTEAKMAIAMALFGGIGILHREMGSEGLIKAILDVKRFMAGKINDPVTVQPEQDLASVRDLELPYTGFPVIDEKSLRGKRTLVGILTRRDMDGKTRECKVSEIMTPRSEMLVGDPATSLTLAKALLRNRKVEKLPLVDADDQLVGLITRRDLDLRDENPNATTDIEGRLQVGAAIGTKDYGVMVKLVGDLIQVGVDFVCIDSAHGGHIQIVQAVQILKREFPNLPIMAGNVADKDSAAELILAGADVLRVGFGSGSICTTRVVSGSGVPQITAIIECREASEEHQNETGRKIPIVSDGGATEPGHSTKAIAAGASAMMFGSLLAGTKESPGEIVKRGGVKFKKYRGMGSEAAMKEHGGERYFKDGEGGKLLAEGVSGLVPYKGPVKDQLEKLHGGLKSGMGYNGAETIQDLWRARIVKVTNAGLKENYPHHLAAIEGDESQGDE